MKRMVVGDKGQLVSTVHLHGKVQLLKVQNKIAKEQQCIVCKLKLQR